ncbi:hypothetical protein RchiOBHm_Chr5g0023261 [Rosa chinensis]|uniref:Uncharacterized protein n=1 Tax=Rosa chinensis TaxID=74649 RepID=A0A2P6Q809_ROSCH|nr:hypothetical protein RchiOBHm_Chr5g0023261 [Rosa chinensis]
MGDSTPLLSESNSAESEPPLLQKHLPSLDSTIELCIGDFGWAQFLQTILVSFSKFFDAQQTFITVFADAEPAWHCTQQLTDNPSSCNSSFSNSPHGTGIGPNTPLTTRKVIIYDARFTACIKCAP